ncbi:MAG TPA: hypothetical protein ENN25_01410 [Euryarchaeota archaeon]|nr:hypothetical protein [Euryarchaeota archaeon]
MDPLRLRVFLTAIVVIVLAAGLSMIWASQDTGREFSYSIDPVDYSKIYYFGIDASGGKELNADYELLNGSMTLSIVTETGIDDIDTEWPPDTSMVELEISNATDGTISWTPDEDGSYYLVMYYFTINGTSVEIEGTYESTVFTPLLYSGIALTVAGSLVALLTVISVGKRKVIESPAEVSTSEPSAEEVEGKVPADEDNNLEN